MTGGVIDIGNAKLTIEGSWLSRRGNRISLQGELKRKDIGTAADYIDIGYVVARSILSPELCFVLMGFTLIRQRHCLVERRHLAYQRSVD
ncbi:MAG: hypothetical protein GPOALKHO_001842 [Sodalis sp.]|nr:MAG: hypothetical protein GPOALKHO_001842 [Sodalis sp.]